MKIIIFGMIIISLLVINGCYKEDTLTNNEYYGFGRGCKELCRNVKMDYYGLDWGEQVSIGEWKDRIVNNNQECGNVRFIKKDMYNERDKNYSILYSYGDCRTNCWWVDKYCPNGYYEGVEKIE